MKKVLAIMLVFASLLAFAACAGKENTAETTATTVAPVQTVAAETDETTKISAVAGKTILLKSLASEDYVEIHTNVDGIATVMLVHKFYADEVSYQAALDKGDYGTYKLEKAIEPEKENEKHQIVFRDTETISGMTYDEIMSEANGNKDYVVVEKQ